MSFVNKKHISSQSAKIYNLGQNTWNKAFFQGIWPIPLIFYSQNSNSSPFYPQSNVGSRARKFLFETTLLRRRRGVTIAAQINVIFNSSNSHFKSGLRPFSASPFF